MILKFSHRFGFPKVKALALREVERTDGLTIVDRIVLYKKHNVELEYLTPLLVQLCARDAYLTREECNFLGADLTYIVSSGRERIRALHHDCRNPIPQSLHGEDMKRAITELLQQTANDRSGGWVILVFCRLHFCTDNIIYCSYLISAKRPSDQGLRAL